MHIPRYLVGADELGVVDAPIWSKAPKQRIDLTGTPLALQPSPFIVSAWRGKPIGKIAALDFSALHNGELLAVHLRWADARADSGQGDNDRFADGAAVMFPLKGDAPLITMGSPEQPVNAWHWRADRPTAACNNVAAGLGTSRVTRNVDIVTAAQHRDGCWQVVFLRKLGTGPASSAAQFVRGASTKIAFAVWQGSNAERGGLKAFSPQWHEFILD